MMIGQYHSTELFLSLRSRELVFVPQALPHYLTAVSTFAKEKWQYHVQWCAKKRAAIYIVIQIGLTIYNIWYLTAFFLIYRMFLAYSNIYRRVSVVNTPCFFLLRCSWVSTTALFSLEQNVPNMVSPNPLLTLRTGRLLVFFFILVWISSITPFSCTSVCRQCTHTVQFGFNVTSNIDLLSTFQHSVWLHSEWPENKSCVYVETNSGLNVDIKPNRSPKHFCNRCNLTCLSALFQMILRMPLSTKLRKCKPLMINWPTAICPHSLWLVSVWMVEDIPSAWGQLAVDLFPYPVCANVVM